MPTKSSWSTALVAFLAVCCGPSANAAAAQRSAAAVSCKKQPGKPFIRGTAGNDRLRGTRRADVIDARGGNDVVLGLGGNDVLCGGPGRDRLDGGRGADMLAGGGGDDRLIGRAGGDRLLGGSGDDVMSGGTADDRLYAGAGDDRVHGGLGADTIDGGTGRDLLQPDTAVPASCPGNGGADRVAGGAGDDAVAASPGDDAVDGGEGNDRLVDTCGDDRLSGGPGADRLAGGDGRDRLRGGAGDDRADGGRGADVLLGEAGADRLGGGSGDDEVRGGPGADIASGGAGRDAVFGGAEADRLFGSSGPDTLSSSAGDVLAGGPGADTFPADPEGGPGSVTLCLSWRSADLSATCAPVGPTTDPCLIPVDPQDPDDPEACGMLAPDEGTDDSCELGPGNDTIVGGFGPDRCSGGAGDDTFVGGPGTDAFVGGPGADVAAMGSGDDDFDGGDGDDRARGGGGADLLLGVAGVDELDGGVGNDSVDGGSGADRIRGGSQRDLLTGGEGTDDLDGEAGDDVLTGGPGADVVVGAGGFDVVTAASGADTCRDAEETFGCASSTGTRDLALPGADAPPAAGPCSRLAAPDGDDAAAGTPQAPWRTVERLMNGIEPGQVGCLAAGATFTEPDDEINVRVKGRPDAPVTIQSAPGASRATIRGRLWIYESATDIVLRDLVLDGTNVLARTASGLPSPTVNGDRITFEGNDVRNPTGACVSLGFPGFGTAEGTVLRHNRIHGCGTGRGGMGIDLVAATDTTVVDNDVFDNGDLGIYVGAPTRRATIARNVVVANAAGIRFERDGSGPIAADVVVERNTFAEHTFAGYPDPVSNGTRTVFGASGVPQPVTNVVRDNCIWHPDANLRIQSDTSDPPYEQSGNSFAQPTFAGSAARDLRVIGGCPLDAQPGTRPARTTTPIAVAGGVPTPDPDDAPAAAAGAQRLQAFQEQPVERVLRAKAEQTSNYVAIIGDSYSSGEGIGTVRLAQDTKYGYYGGECHKHALAWGSQAASRIGAQSSMIACSGAKVADVLRRSQPDRDVPPQLEALRATARDFGRPRSVVMSIGGNDLGFADIVAKCVQADTFPWKDDADCFDALLSARRKLDTGDFFRQILEVHQEVKNAVDGTTVVVLGYPTIFSTTGGNGDCAGRLRLSKAHRKTFRKLQLGVNAVIADVAGTVGLRYAATAQVIPPAHRLCSADNKTDFFVQIKPTGQETVHPNSLGHTAMAGPATACLRSACPDNPRKIRDLDGESLEDDGVALLPEPAAAVPPPALTRTGTELRVGWTAVPGAGSYEVHRGAGARTRLLDESQGTAVTITSLPASATGECVRVIAFNANGTGSTIGPCSRIPAPGGVTRPTPTTPRPTRPTPDPTPPGGGAEGGAGAPATRPPTAENDLIKLCQGQSVIRTVIAHAQAGTSPIRSFRVLSTNFGRADFKFSWEGNGRYSITIPKNANANAVLTVGWDVVDASGRDSNDAVRRMEINGAGSC